MFASTVSNRPVTIAQQISPQNFTLNFSNVPVKPIYHLSVFMLPDVQFDPSFTALIYYQIQTNNPDSGMPSTELATANGFRLLGCLNQEKQSSIFKLNPGKLIKEHEYHQEGDIDMDMDVDAGGSSLTDSVDSVNILIGISVEPNDVAFQQLETLRVNRSVLAATANASAPATSIKPSQQEILAVSNKIIGNAYNFLSSFADNSNKVDLSKFNDWWNKFKVKMANEPDYLEKLE